MLSAQLTLALEPVVEEVRTGLHYLQMLKCDVVETLGLIVAVDFLQMLVEQGCKLVKACRLLGELDEPLVATLGITCLLYTSPSPRD